VNLGAHPKLGVLDLGPDGVRFFTIAPYLALRGLNRGSAGVTRTLYGKHMITLSIYE